MRAAAALFPDRDLALGIDLVDPVVSRIGEVDAAVLVDGGIGCELVPLYEQFPVFPWFQDGVDATIADPFGLCDGLWIILPNPA